MKKITIYYPDDAPKPELELLQAAVGGLIEPVDHNHPRSIAESYARNVPPTECVTVAYANEEGRYRFPDSPAPREALVAIDWPECWAPIFGPVVVCEGWTRAEHTGEINDDAGEA